MLGKDLDARVRRPSRTPRCAIRSAARPTPPFRRSTRTSRTSSATSSRKRPATSRSAPTNVARRYRAEELIDTPLDATGRDRRARARATRRPSFAPRPTRSRPDAIRRRRGAPSVAIIRSAGDVVAATQRIVDSLAAFVVGARHRDAAAERARRRRTRAAVRPRLRVDARVAAAREDAGQERLLHLGHAARSRPRRRGGVARAVQLCVARQHGRARSDARTLAALDVHASHARQGSAHLDRVESVPAAVVRAGRLGALRRADGARRRIRRRRSAPAARAAERRAHARLPVALGHQAAHAAVDARRRAALLRAATRTSRHPPRAARPSAARTIRRTAATSSARWPFSSCAPTTPRSCGAQVHSPRLPRTIHDERHRAHLGASPTAAARRHAGDHLE